MRGEVDQIRSIEKRNYLYSFGQNFVIELLDLGLDTLQSRIGIVTLLQQHLPLNHVWLVDNCVRPRVSPSSTDLSQADLRALVDDGNVLNANGRAVHR